MKKSFSKKLRAGFTLAELLIAVALLAILSGIGAVSVIKYRRNLKLLEANNIAKDIFVVEQNHISAAQSSGKLIVEDYQAVSGETATDTNADNLIVMKSHVNVGECSYYTGREGVISVDYYSMLLPSGAIDSTITNRYIVTRFDPVSATILDVFYSENYDITTVDYSELDAVKDDSEARKHFGDSNNGIVGYYGKTAGLDKAPILPAPKLVVHNEEILYLEVLADNKFFTARTANPSNATATVFITSVGDGATFNTSFQIDDSNSKISAADGRLFIVLDDITTTGNRFADKVASVSSYLDATNKNIKVRVELETSTTGNSASSPELIVNPLFADTADTDSSIRVKNIRHLENLDDASGTPFTNVSVSQENNLNWGDFSSKVNQLHTKIITTVDPAKLHVKYDPIDVTYDIDYDGNNFYIDSISERSLTSDAGLFGKVESDLSVSNIELRNFNLKTSAGDAGALVGKSIGNLSIDNVISYNTVQEPETPSVLVQIETENGNAGGLVGSVNNGTLVITKSAAAVYVKGTASSGGLIGNADNVTTSGSITLSYSGGHIASDAATGETFYITDSSSVKQGRPNVIATGTNGKAGGLVGSAAGVVSIDKCYSTSSVSGNTRNTLSNGGSIVHSTGFGWLCQNSYEDEDDKYPNVSKADTFFNGGTSSVLPYNNVLNGKKYPFRSIEEVASETGETIDAWFLKEHVGDWHITGPEQTIVNTPISG